MTRFIHILIAIACTGIHCAYADDVPLDVPEKNLTTTNLGKIRWQIISADNASDVGFFDIAEEIYTTILQNETLAKELKQSVGLKLARVLLNQSQFEKAKETLSKLPTQEGSRYLLISAITDFQLNDIPSAKKKLEQVELEVLKTREKPWFNILQAMLLIKNDKWPKARPLLEEAKLQAHSLALKSKIDSLIFKSDIYSGKDPEGLEKKLRRKINRKDGAPPALELVKQYAVVLGMMGRKNAAISTINDALRTLSYSRRGEIDALLVLKALITGPETPEGEKAFKDILERGNDVEACNLALSLLAGSKKGQGERASFFDFLVDVEKNSRGIHHTLDSIILTRAQILTKMGDLEGAQIEANRLLEDFPGSSNKLSAIALLAEIMWSYEKPKYRKAADYLAQMIQSVQADQERIQLMTLVADCYFLNTDYENAVEIYQSIIKENKHNDIGPILYQLVLAKLNSGNLEEVEQLLDSHRHDPLVDPMNQWRAEWNLISTMKRQGYAERAFERIRDLLKTLPDAAITPDLVLRLVWLKAELSLESGNYQETPELADKLISLLKSFSSSSIDSEQVKLISSQSLLLKGQALLEGKKIKKGLQVMQTLRDAYSDSKAAVMSYIIEARHYSSVNNMARAQQQLIHLSDRYPKSDHAPVALYEAALNAEARATLSTYQEALGILERLSTDYPFCSLVYHARLKQGHILRKLGNFNEAELIYKNLSKDYPNHPLKYRTEIARLDCILASANDNPDKLANVSRYYNRVFDTQNISVDIRAEAGFKAGFSKMKSKEYSCAKEIYWQTISLLTSKDSQALNISEQARYWISRCIFDIGKIYEKDQLHEKAHEAYKLIAKYKLPGKALAQLRMK